MRARRASQSGSSSVGSGGRPLAAARRLAPSSAAGRSTPCRGAPSHCVGRVRSGQIRCGALAGTSRRKRSPPDTSTPETAEIAGEGSGSSGSVCSKTPGPTRTATVHHDRRNELPRREAATTPAVAHLPRVRHRISAGAGRSDSAGITARCADTGAASATDWRGTHQARAVGRPRRHTSSSMPSSTSS